MRADYAEHTVEELIELRERGFVPRKARKVRVGDLLSYHAYGEWDLVLSITEYIEEEDYDSERVCLRVMRTKHEGIKHISLGFRPDVELLFVQSSSDV